MNVEICLEIWNALRSHLLVGDVEEAADDFMHVLIENGANAEEIAEYALSPELRSALMDYTELDEEDEDEDPDELNFG